MCRCGHGQDSRGSAAVNSVCLRASGHQCSLIRWAYSPPPLLNPHACVLSTAAVAGAGRVSTGASMRPPGDERRGGRQPYHCSVACTTCRSVGARRRRIRLWLTATEGEGVTTHVPQHSSRARANGSPWHSVAKVEHATIYGMRPHQRGPLCPWSSQGVNNIQANPALCCALGAPTKQTNGQPSPSCGVWGAPSRQPKTPASKHTKSTWANATCQLPRAVHCSTPHPL